jgi:hypothetical protein
LDRFVRRRRESAESVSIMNEKTILISGMGIAGPTGLS